MRKATISLLSIGVLIGAIAHSCQPNVSIETAQYAVNGQKLYRTHCENCHGLKGEGLGALYPPLTDSSYLREKRDRLACIVKNGISEPIEILGKKYEETMPGVPQLSSIEIAYILTYITTTFGNETSSYTVEEVKKGLADCR